MPTIREQLKTTFLGLAGLLSKINVMQSEAESGKQEILDAIGNIPEPDLSAIAKESTLTQGVQDIREDISHIDIDTSDLAKEATLGDVQDVLEYIEQGGMPEIAAIAKQGTNPNATLSEVQTQATSAASDAADAKIAAQAITGYALQGSDATATNTAIAALIGYTIQEIDGV